ncbi:hypothetical protein BDV18DRAFT_147295 [Aspergillus unguis]
MTRCQNPGSVGVLSGHFCASSSELHSMTFYHHACRQPMSDSIEHYLKLPLFVNKAVLSN